jgi:AAHS family 3-hydroxyphenylpropionic acid transporter
MAADTTASAVSTARLTLWLCFAVAVLEGYDLQVLAIAGPLLRAAMQLNPQQMGVAFSASLMGLALGAAIGGTLADRIGRKQVLVVSVVGLGLFTLATALAHDFHTLLTLRILAGVAMGGAMPNLIAIAAVASGQGHTTSKVTAMICGMPTGGVIAALGGHVLAARFGWHGLFVFGGAMTLCIVPFLMWRLVAAGPQQPRGSARGSVQQSLFGEGRAATTLMLWMLFILTLALFSLFAGWAPTLVVDKGLPASAGFSTLMAINVGGITGALIVAALCDRWNVRSAMLVSYAGMAISLWLFSSSSVARTVIPLAGLVGFFVLGAQCALYGVSPQLYPPVNYATGVGSAVAAGRIGSIIGPIVAGNAMGLGATANDVVFWMVPVALLAGAVLLGLAAVSGDALKKTRPAAH